MTIPTWNPTPPVLEKVVRLKITKLLESVGFKVYWVEQSNDRKRARSDYTKGVPDIFAVHIAGDIIVWIECKGIKTGREASVAQKDFREYVEIAGGQCIIGSNNMKSRGGYTEVCDALVQWGLIG